jgi:hypothetical protein
MAGYLPHLALLPKTMYSPYREGERKSMSAPNSVDPSFSSSPPTLERSNTETPRSFGFHGHSPKPSASFRTSKLPHSLAKATPPPRQNATPLPTYSSDSHSSLPQSQAPSSPSPALDRTGSIRPRSPFPFFKYGRGFTEPANSKPKRNKLVKKGSISQPTFVMVSPNTARAERVAMEAGAAELGLQLADAVAKMETSAGVGPVRVLGADGNSVAVASTDGDGGAEVDHQDCKQIKRWSRAPLLPEFDFSSTCSNSNPLFDSMIDEATTRDSEPTAEPIETTSVISDLRQAATQARTATTLTLKDASKPTYRCSIHAQNSASHLAVERACCELVTEAGGRILDSYSFPGGFMFWIPQNVSAPIATCELPARGVKIELARWREFPLPNFDGLKMNPPSRTFNEEWLAVHSEAAQVEAAERLSGQINTQKRVQTWNNALTAWEKSKGKHGQSTPKRHNTAKESFMSSKGATEGTHRCLPASLETIRRCGHEESSAIENVSFIPRSAKHSHGNSEHRFTVVSDVPDSEDESGGEEWESVRSELDG